ncbi:hypothetical protein HOF65_07610 [bacterium]|nr:hypothetical protein [bacterium]MBT3853770.1 hypothetical protein [bacterium]MBT4632943.1 hypothetical protein [bacterium]
MIVHFPILAILSITSKLHLQIEYISFIGFIMYQPAHLIHHFIDSFKRKAVSSHNSTHHIHASTGFFTTTSLFSSK